MSDKLVYGNSDVTVHVTQGKVDSQFGNFEVVEGHSLTAGESYPLDKLAEYQQKSIEAGEVPGLEVVSKSEAEKKNADLEKVKQLMGVSSGVNVQSSVLAGPDANDNSHSDHQVPDEVKAGNLAAEAEAESGKSSSDGGQKAVKSETK